MSKKLPLETVHEVRDSCLCLATQRAARSLARRFDRAFAVVGLTNGQFSLMMALNAPQAPTVGALAEFLAMDRTTLTAALKALERRGLVRVAADEKDRRARRLFLTPAGRDALLDALPIWRAEHRRLEEELAATDVEGLRASLREIGATHTKGSETVPVKAVPDGFHTVTPHIVCAGAAEAIEFYKKAFGATEIFRLPGPDGKLMHASVRIGDSMVMLVDEMPQWGALGPKARGGSSVTIHLSAPDVDALFAQAVAAGATVKMPVADMFWGDRYGVVIDPFGHEWSIATHVKEMTPEEIAKAGMEAMKNAPSCPEMGKTS